MPGTELPPYMAVPFEVSTLLCVMAQAEGKAPRGEGLARGRGVGASADAAASPARAQGGDGAPPQAGPVPDPEPLDARLIRLDLWAVVLSLQRASGCPGSLLNTDFWAPPRVPESVGQECGQNMRF